MSYKIAVLPGDGIGPEVTTEAQKTLTTVAERFGHDLQFTEALAGGAGAGTNAVSGTGSAGSGTGRRGCPEPGFRRDGGGGKGYRRACA